MFRVTSPSLSSLSQHFIRFLRYIDHWSLIATVSMGFVLARSGFLSPDSILILNITAQHYPPALARSRCQRLTPGYDVWCLPLILVFAHSVNYARLACLNIIILLLMTCSQGWNVENVMSQHCNSLGDQTHLAANWNICKHSPVQTPATASPLRFLFLATH